MSCPFCDRKRGFEENGFAMLIDQEGYEVSPGHFLAVPKRHVSSIFDCTSTEIHAMLALIKFEIGRLNQDIEPDGYNIGVNVGEAAGQTVMHAHIHVIPRFKGDCVNPRGGVRGVIPGKMNY